MSAYVKQETVMNDQAALLEALKNKGYDVVEVNEKAKELVDYVGKTRPETAELIIRRKYIPGPSNDIGFKKDAKGNYEAIISQYDQGKHNTKWLDELKQDYGVIKAKKIAKQKGWTMLKQTSKNGTTKIQFTVKA